MSEVAVTPLVVPAAQVVELPVTGVADPVVLTTIEAPPLVLQPIGPRGPAGGLADYVHTQAVAATVWTVNHNLGRKPLVLLTTPGGVAFDGAVTHVSDTQAVVSLALAATGQARCL